MLLSMFKGFQYELVSENPDIVIFTVAFGLYLQGKE
jgi:hypothetical protein